MNNNFYAFDRIILSVDKVFAVNVSCELCHMLGA